MTDNDDLTDSDTTTVKVSTPTSPPPSTKPNKEPVADAGSNQTVYVNETVYFDGSESYDLDGSIMSWSWNFGDGNTASGVTVSHTYQEPGNYTVTLTVKDNRNAEISNTCSVEVREIPPTLPPPPIIPPLPPILSDLTITPSKIELGNEVTIGFVITNIDNQSITYIVTMRIGELTLLVDVELNPYEAETVSRTITQWTEGTYNVAVDGMTGSFMVESATTPPKPAEFVVSDLTVSPREVEPEDEIIITALITNIGEEKGEYLVTLNTALGTTSWEVNNYHTIEAGESETTEFKFIPETEGTYDVAVDGLTDSFTVTAPPGFILSPRYITGILIIPIIAILYVLWKKKLYPFDQAIRP